MRITNKVRNILENFGSDNIGTKANLFRILMSGRLAGTGRLVILPVDQGFEHGPDRSFLVNSDAYDPLYHHKLAIDAGLSAYAAPLGMLEASSDKFAGAIPTILKLNNANSLVASHNQPDQALTGSVADAIRLGCSAVGMTVYPGSDNYLSMIEVAREIIAEAKAYSLAAVIWSYPRGASISKEGETAIDICAYAAHMAALIGAHIIKVKLPTDFIEQAEAKKTIEKYGTPISKLEERVAHVVKSCFAGRRLVIFSGGVSKDEYSLLNEVLAIKKGGGNGSIIGRNVFQRPRHEALDLLNKVIKIYRER